MRPARRLPCVGLMALAAIAALAGTGLAADYVVVIDKMKFGPMPAELHPGDTLVWRNNDILRHTATARDKRFDIDLPAHAEARMEVGAAGTIEVYCRFHPGMKATMIVTP